MTNPTIKRALLSVSDKTNILELAKFLHQNHIEILSTGGTAQLLSEHNIPVIEVSDYTRFPEIMGGRVKTLHPKVHGGILARRGIDEKVMQDNDINPIDLVVVNLYPFAETIAKINCSLEDAVENIDIGGPTMIRSAAKNFDSVTVIVDPDDYPKIMEQIKETASLSKNLRFHYAIKAFEHTAQYDDMISNYFGKLLPSYYGKCSNEDNSIFPRTLNKQFIKKQELRYGENAHQKAAFYVDNSELVPSISTAKQLQGKELSYNNIADTDAALECVLSFNEPACVIVKHANPCGAAIGENSFNAYQRAFKTDPTSAFGGIIAFNTLLDESTAQAIIKQQFVEVIIAPEIAPTALTIFASKPNIRLLTYGHRSSEVSGYDFKRVTGGLLVQERDIELYHEHDLTIVTERHPTPEEKTDLLFCWEVAKFVKSNAIVYAKNGMTIGIGAGQMSRVYSAKIAGIKAEDEGLQIHGSVMASDAFFPFRDGIDAAAKVGVTAIIQPGGSIRDPEVIQAANEHNIAMIFTKMRHFRH